jgi:hypothetical protein
LDVWLLSEVAASLAMLSLLCVETGFWCTCFFGQSELGSLSKCSVKVGIGTDQVQVLRDARLVGAGRRIQSNTNNKCERQNLESRNPDRTNASAGLLDMAVALYPFMHPGNRRV